MVCTIDVVGCAIVHYGHLSCAGGVGASIAPIVGAPHRPGAWRIATLMVLNATRVVMMMSSMLMVVVPYLDGRSCQLYVDMKGLRCFYSRSYVFISHVYANSGSQDLVVDFSEVETFRS